MKNLTAMRTPRKTPILTTQPLVASGMTPLMMAPWMPPLMMAAHAQMAANRRGNGRTGARTCSASDGAQTRSQGVLDSARVHSPEHRLDQHR